MGPGANPPSPARRAGHRLLVALTLLAMPAAAAMNAQPVQIEHGGLKLNGNLVASSHRQRPVFLVLHGTWAHRNMEIIRDLQSLLAEAGAPSLAITLSLGVDDREGFMRCEPPIRARHGQAVEELRAWRDYLLARGWERIVLVGHSRGGNQVSLYQKRYHDPAIRELVLLAPMVWQQDAVRKDYRAATGTDLAPLIRRARRHPQGVLVVPKLVNCENVEATGESFLSYYGAEPEKDTPTVLAGLSTPTHVYLGTTDPISGRFETAIRQRGEPAHVTLHHVDGAGHFFRDFYLDEISEDLLARWEESAP